jgi:hypothetical protein
VASRIDLGLIKEGLRLGDARDGSRAQENGRVRCLATLHANYPTNRFARKAGDVGRCQILSDKDSGLRQAGNFSSLNSQGLENAVSHV